MMKNLFVGAFFATVVFSAPVFPQDDKVNIVPQPADYERRDGNFVLNRQTKIVVARPTMKRNGETLRQEIFRRYGFKLKITSKLQKRDFILLDLVGQGYAALREKGEYHLIVEDHAIRVLGGPEGQFYGIQTLLQLMPHDAETSVKVHAATIYDGPRFPYRGMHLDVGRHFMPVEFVKKYIDLMSQYKFNYFHWGLTQDQGWRIESKKFPRLTEVGAFRKETVKERNLTPYIGDGVPHGGFYTQGEVKEVIAYAKARYITVIPEINVPGHSSAVLAAYPQYGCKQDYQYKVQTTWGIFKEVLCPTEDTFKFLEEVFGELIELFPDSPYIHIGGDEVLKDHWKESPFVQELKKRENLKDEHEVQSYFIRRVEKFINSKGKKIIGWDEILEGGLAPNATVMSWRGMRGGIQAARAKHDVIMAPTDFVYFDYGQGDPAYEPLNIGSYVPLEKVYSFEPVPKELNADEAKYVIGGQANVWTEYIKSPSHVEYMAFPRMLALSEVLWSQPEGKNYEDFRRRLNAHLPRLDTQNVNYRILEPGGLQNVVTNNERTSITLVPATGTRIFYTVDGSTPTEMSAQYKKPFEIKLDEGNTATLKTIVVNAKSRKSVVYAATIVRDMMRPAVEPKEKRPGVSYELIVPSDAAEPTRIVAESRSIFLPQFASKIDLKKAFTVSFDGYLNVPTDGVYEFQVDSTWDTTIVLGNRTLIDGTGDATRKVRSAIIPLKAGWHQVSLRYNHRGGDAAFRVRYGIKGQGLRQIGGSELVH